MTAPDGYSDEDARQHRLNVLADVSTSDRRSPFQHDVDRILYSTAFRALAGKTQVVASDEAGGFHNRLTHTLKVAQLGRRMAVLLTPDGVPGPDPDLVEAACLAHDIGHPPFGHAGESALTAKYVELAGERLAKEQPAPKPEDQGDAPPPCSPDPATGGPVDGFEGNAQNLRIVTYLASRKTRVHRGLHLTRACLDATMKYPWRRGSGLSADSLKKFGIYAEDDDSGAWAIEGAPAGLRPVEEQIMDWADDITYACHDVEDFFRAGLIPLHLLLDFPAPDRYGRHSELEPPELASFLDAVEAKYAGGAGGGFDRSKATEWMRDLQNLVQVIQPHRGRHEDKQLITSVTSRLISHFLTGIHLEATADPAGPLTRYNARLHIPTDRRQQCDLLKQMIWYFVIDRPELASQQHGQSRVIRELLTWHLADPGRLLPPDRLEELEEHGNDLRVACDHVASLTERQALDLYYRMSGVRPGALTDKLY